MNEKYNHAKNLVDYLSGSEVSKLLEYCRRQFPKAYQQAQPSSAYSIKEVEKAINNLRMGKPFTLKKILQNIEKDVILRTLNRFKKQTKAAEFLGIKEQTLRYKMARYKIPSVRIDPNYYIGKQTD